VSSGVPVMAIGPNSQCTASVTAADPGAVRSVVAVKPPVCPLEADEPVLAYQAVELT
jgi:hypothetical protein